MSFKIQSKVGKILTLREASLEKSSKVCHSSQSFRIINKERYHSLCDVEFFIKSSLERSLPELATGSLIDQNPTKLRKTVARDIKRNAELCRR